MKRVIFLFFIIGTALSLQPRSSGRIVGGYNVDIVDYPYQLSLRRNGEHVCGAAILSNNWAITAAHCVDAAMTSKTLLVSGSTYLSQAQYVHLVEKFVIHPQYNSRTLDYNLALVQVYKLDNFRLGAPGVEAIEIAEYGISPGYIGEVSGWGITVPSRSSEYSDHLKAVWLRRLYDKECEGVYDNYSPRMMCFGTAERDACYGDSGGPLVKSNGLTNELVGVVSFGYGCAILRYPRVFTDVPKQIEWIKSVIG